jgi:N-formylglutamate amidohydrolase
MYGTTLISDITRRREDRKEERVECAIVIDRLFNLSDQLGAAKYY